MKKVIFIAVVAVAFLASCKKDRVCTCTYSGGGTSIVTYTESKKADARAACLSTTSNGGTATCSLN